MTDTGIANFIFYFSLCCSFLKKKKRILSLAVSTTGTCIKKYGNSKRKKKCSDKIFQRRLVVCMKEIV
jgi:hypothetical protein